LFFRQNDTRINYPYSIRLAMPKGISWQRNDIFCASRTVWICTLVNFFRHNDTRTDYPYSIRLAMPKGISWQRNDIFYASRTFVL
ncbi:MAG: hypothetical protein IKT77_03575, partial [Paludibacteraceae bacterium]|nr:hypothetical protein [Paludibacteraceae bacterium]